MKLPSMDLVTYLTTGGTYYIKVPSGGSYEIEGLRYSFDVTPRESDTTVSYFVGYDKACTSTAYAKLGVRLWNGTTVVETDQSWSSSMAGKLSCPASVTSGTVEFILCGTSYINYTLTRRSDGTNLAIMAKKTTDEDLRWLMWDVKKIGDCR